MNPVQSVDRGRDPISDALNAGLQNEAPEARAARLEGTLEQLLLPQFSDLTNPLSRSAAEEHARLRSADIDKEISKARKSDFGKGARGLEDHKALDKAPKGSQVSLMLLLARALLLLGAPFLQIYADIYALGTLKRRQDHVPVTVSFRLRFSKFSA